MASGNSNFQVSDLTVSATDFVFRKRWHNYWMRHTPVLSSIKEGKERWQKVGTISSDGKRALIPVIYDDATTPAAGRSDANELVPIPPTAISGLSQAVYEIAHYIKPLWIKDTQTRLNNDAYANMLEGATQQLMASFANVMANHIEGSSVDSRTNLLGIQYAIAAANTVGGIDQSTETDWRGQVASAVGAFDLDLIDEMMDLISTRNGKVDLIVCSIQGGNNLYGAFRSKIAPAERAVNANFKAKYGFESIVYREATVVGSSRLSNGVICGLDTRSWFYKGDERPRQVMGRDRLQGTDATEQMFNMYGVLGCAGPQRNFKLTGVSA